MVAAAIELAGGPTAVAELCGVRRQSVYVWIKEWKVERLVDALKQRRNAIADCGCSDLTRRWRE